MKLNRICIDEELQCIALSLIDPSYIESTSNLSKDFLERCEISSGFECCYRCL